MLKLLKNMIGDKRGVAAVEMGLVLGFVTVAVVGAITGLGEETNLSLQTTSNKVAAATQDAIN